MVFIKFWTLRQNISYEVQTHFGGIYNMLEDEFNITNHRESVIKKLSEVRSVSPVPCNWFGDSI